jgi:hypothetical protein
MVRLTEPRIDERNTLEIAKRLREQAADGRVRLTVHGHQEMVEENCGYDSLREALLDCQVVENYPDHQRGACCLVCGRDRVGRYLHVVCTTTREVLIVITVYEPKPPKWPTPFQRGDRHEV